MKPKVFIGSSVEGLNVAYAIQQNLTHDAEATVWDQGLFELSKTTIESLDKSLEIMDFGIFVFSDDDITIMRGNESSTIRDNVLFEFGLFIGKIGRERVFFVVPDGSSVHLATDLLGITPGKYDPNREDKSLQAATGAVCNSIRIQMDKLGLLRDPKELEDATGSSDKEETYKTVWFDDFIEKDYTKAKEKLEKEMLTKDGDDIFIDQVWMSYINFKINEKNALFEISELFKKHSDNDIVVNRIMDVLLWEDYIDKAIEFGEITLKKIEKKNTILIKLANCHKKNGDLNIAQELLNSNDPTNNPDIAVALSRLNENKSEALSILYATYQTFPNNENLIYTFIRQLYDENYDREALHLCNFLTKNYSDNAEYWGYQGNLCLNLKLYDKAMIFYKKADEISKSSESWILGNIGNLLNQKGFYSEAIKSLKKALEYNDESDYSHDRLSAAIKNKEEEDKKFIDICKEGRKLLRSFNPVEEV